MEKQFGSRFDVDELVIQKRRKYYRQILETNPKNYDIWFDLLFLEKSTKDFAEIRKTFEEAVSQVPPANEKRYWKRYIYIWIMYASWEELDSKDIEKAK